MPELTLNLHHKMGSLTISHRYNACKTEESREKDEEFAITRVAFGKVDFEPGDSELPGALAGSQICTAILDGS